MRSYPSFTSVSYLWREPQAPQEFRSGISLHSHTSHSKETLAFLAELSTDFGYMQPFLRWAEDRCFRCSGMRPDYRRSFWTPPLTPRLAFDLERTQIENKLQLPALVSLSDHDEISAPLLLRALPSAGAIPVSTEWSVPYSAPDALNQAKPTDFHLGIHNLPSGSALEWIARLNAFTAMPVETRPEHLLSEVLADLHAIPDVLIVFNHPLWDLFRNGEEIHRVLVNDFLARHGQFIHALELNGLRDWDENRAVQRLAQQWNQLVISGGDRHGVEPNANLNLTQATSFVEFVHEVRRERMSHILFMPQYKQPWKHRIMESTLDAIRYYPNFPEGSRRWDERVYAPNSKGEVRPISELWNGGLSAGKTPVYLDWIVSAVLLMGSAPVSQGLKLAWGKKLDMHAVLSKLAD